MNVSVSFLFLEPSYLLVIEKLIWHWTNVILLFKSDLLILSIDLVPCKSKDVVLLANDTNLPYSGRFGGGIIWQFKTNILPVFTFVCQPIGMLAPASGSYVAALYKYLEDRPVSYALGLVM